MMNMYSAPVGMEMTPYPVQSDVSENSDGNASKRRVKCWMPEECKNPMYWDKRQKNNVAAKKSRENKRLCDNIIKEKVFLLEEENERLRKEVASLKERFGVPIEQALGIHSKGKDTDRDDIDVRVSSLTHKNRKLIQALRSKNSYLELETNKCSKETVQNADAAFVNNVRTNAVICETNLLSGSMQSGRGGSEPALPTGLFYNINATPKADQVVQKANCGSVAHVSPTEKQVFHDPRLAIPNRLFDDGGIRSCERQSRPGSQVGEYPVYCYESAGMYCSAQAYPCGDVMQIAPTTNNYDACMGAMNLSVKQEDRTSDDAYDMNNHQSNRPINGHSLDDEVQTGVMDYSLSSVSSEEIPRPSWVRVVDEVPDFTQAANCAIKSEVVDADVGDADMVNNAMDAVVRSPVKGSNVDAQMRRENENLKVKINALSSQIKTMRRTVME